MACSDAASTVSPLTYPRASRYLPIACLDCERHPLLCQTAARFDCSNPESSGDLVVRQLQVEVRRFGSYALCDVWDRRGPSCNYTCFRPALEPVSDGVGVERVCGMGRWPWSHGCLMAPRPVPIVSEAHWDYWNWNLAARFGDAAGGVWYSLPSKGEGRDWRRARVLKATNARCHARRVDAAVAEAGSGCFSTCPMPANRSSGCWIDCWFETVLGQGAGSRLKPMGEQEGAMPLEQLRRAWLAGFDDPADGGCAACPAEGPCPDEQPEHARAGLAIAQA
jgi:hypothetical protein